MEHPLLFTTEMVIRILTCARCGKISVEYPCCHCGSEEFCKTQTRRVPVERYRNWKVGDTIWVRETFAQCGTVMAERIAYICYKADNPLLGATTRMKKCEVPKDKPFLKTVRKYRPSIHIPRWAARIFLKITGLRDERVQDITLEDVIREGVKDAVKCVYRDNVSKCDHHETINKFKYLWDSINAKRHNGIYAWDKNPIDKVIEFKRITEFPKKE